MNHKFGIEADLFYKLYNDNKNNTYAERKE